MKPAVAAALALLTLGALAGHPRPAAAGPAAHPVGMVTMTFVDRHRSTPGWEGQARQPERTLVTTVLYPASGQPGPAGPVRGAAPDRSAAPYPLIVFAHGLGATPQDYETLLSHWASEGYVVAAPLFPLTHTGTPGGLDEGDIANQPGDMSFVITSALAATRRRTGTLAGMIDPHAVGAAGHSNGAITTLGLVANTCCHDRGSRPPPSSRDRRTRSTGATSTITTRHPSCWSTGPPTRTSRTATPRRSSTTREDPKPS